MVAFGRPMATRFCLEKPLQVETTLGRPPSLSSLQSSPRARPARRSKRNGPSRDARYADIVVRGAGHRIEMWRRQSAAAEIKRAGTRGLRLSDGDIGA